MAERKNILLRLDPAVHDALARWAADELRSTTAQIEYLLRLGLSQAGRLPRDVGGMPKRGRPPKGSGTPPAEPASPPAQAPADEAPEVSDGDASKDSDGEAPEALAGDA